eukprot:Partr_v1_DN28199_c1_g1_i2_m55343 putative enhancer of polycomb homolog
MAVDAKEAPSALYIPTPDASVLIDFFNHHYNRPFKRPATLIRSSALVEECIVGPAYCLDDRDLEWLSQFNSHVSDPSLELSADGLEALLGELERITDDMQSVSSLVSDPVTAGSLLCSFDDLQGFLASGGCSQAMRLAATRVFEYWVSRRSGPGFNGRSLMQKLKYAEVVKGESDPYICFRKRDVRTTRKTRRADTMSIQKLRQLKVEMETARSLLDMTVRRERMRKEYLLLEQAIFEQKLLIRRARSEFGIPDSVFDEARAARKRAAKLRFNASTHASGGVASGGGANNISGGNGIARTAKSSSGVRKRLKPLADDESLYKDPIMVEIENEVALHVAAMADWEDVTETGVQLSSHPARGFFTRLEGPDFDASISAYHIRRRLGRGGRILIDRRPHPVDDMAAASKRFKLVL